MRDETGREGSAATEPVASLERGNVPDGDAVLGHGVVRVVEQVRGVQERLGGDAPHVQAGAAQGASPLDAGDFQPELRALDGGDVSAGAAADHDDVLLLAGGVPARAQGAEGRGEPRRAAGGHQSAHRRVEAGEKARLRV